MKHFSLLFLISDALYRHFATLLSPIINVQPRSSSQTIVFISGLDKYLYKFGKAKLKQNFVMFTVLKVRAL